jgi:hypothetical protein
MSARQSSSWASRDSGGHDAARRAVDGAPRHRPRPRGLSAEQEAVLEIQRLAGNRAVNQALTAARSAGKAASIDAISLKKDGRPPAKGIAEIRAIAEGQSVLAYTVRSIDPLPPIMLPDAAEKVEGGYACRAQKVDTIGEPDVKEWWPKQGRHKIASNHFIEVSPDWERTLEKGEDEHGADARLAWELTWKLVKDRINRFAVKPGPVAPTPEAAERALWKQYVAGLPRDLQPEGDTVNPSKQLDVLGVKAGTFFTWMWEATVSRDGRHYHEAKTEPSKTATNVPKNVNVEDIVADPKFQVPGPEPKAFLKEMRGEYTKGRANVGSKIK